MDIVTEHFLYDIAAQILPLIGGTVIGYLWNQSKGLTERQKAVYAANRAILKLELRRIYATAQAAGEISFDDQQTAEEIYQSYHTLGGNGQGTTIMESIRMMKMKK